MFFAASVFPVPSPQCPALETEMLDHVFDSIAYTARAEQLIKDSGMSCFVFSDLPVRNWDEWIDEKRVHVFELPITVDNGTVSVAGVLVLPRMPP